MKQALFGSIRSESADRLLRAVKSGSSVALTGLPETMAAFLAAKLEKPVSFFLEEKTVASPNQDVMKRAREAWAGENPDELMAALREYRRPDPVFDEEYHLLGILAVLEQAKAAMTRGQYPLAGTLLEDLGEIQGCYCADMLEHRRLLLLGKAQPKLRREVCRKLPPLDEELLLRARNALDGGLLDRSAVLLDAAEDHSGPEWNYLRGEVYLAEGRFTEAAPCYHKAEAAYPEKTAPRLERCYRELEDFKRAYHYACLQK